MPRLLTIPISHFCEKARWALDRSGIEYEEERHVQGVHRVVSRRAGGSGKLPVLIANGDVLTESEQILLWADARSEPDQRLFPDDTDARDDVLALCRHFDATLGPDSRRLIYAYLLPHRDELLEVNNQGVPAWEDRFIRAGWPLLKRFVTRGLGIGPSTIRDDGIRVRHELDQVAKRLADGRPYLCGERFSAADLTFAALGAALVLPPEYGLPLPPPDELPGPVGSVVHGYRDHPAGAFVLKMFHSHR